jgi:hypothetical protein
MDSKKREQENDQNQININESKSDNLNQFNKSFSNIIKQIIDYNNEKFLNGEMNVIEYIISKQVNVEISEIKKLEKFTIKMISDYGILNMIGECLPNLMELILTGSIIPSISDIGSKFANLKILHVNSCGINDLSGINVII